MRKPDYKAAIDTLTVLINDEDEGNNFDYDEHSGSHKDCWECSMINEVKYLLGKGN